MYRKYIFLWLIIIIALILSSCSQGSPKPDGVITSAELLAQPVYNTPIEVLGQVHGLGEFECPCFALKSGDEQIYVWFDMMVEEDGSPAPPTRTPVDIDGIENDDWVVVTGELKYLGDYKVQKDFWLTEFEIIQKDK